MSEPIRGKMARLGAGFDMPGSDPADAVEGSFQYTVVRVTRMATATPSIMSHMRSARGFMSALGLANGIPARKTSNSLDFEG
jgi:hypothetical protein